MKKRVLWRFLWLLQLVRRRKRTLAETPVVVCVVEEGKSLFSRDAIILVQMETKKQRKNQ